MQVSSAHRVAVAVRDGDPFVGDALARSNVVVIGPTHLDDVWHDTRNRALSVTAVAERHVETTQAVSAADVIVVDCEDRYVRLIPWLRGRGQQRLAVVVGPDDLLGTLLAFDLGADEVLPRPLVGTVLASRLNALARRCSREPAGRYRHGDLLLDDVSHEVFVGDREVVLTPTEFAMLRRLMRRPCSVVTRRELCSLLRGECDLRSVNPHMRHLRLKLGGWRIRCVPDVGYCLADDGSGRHTRQAGGRKATGAGLGELSPLRSPDPAAPDRVFDLRTGASGPTGADLPVIPAGQVTTAGAVRWRVA